MHTNHLHTHSELLALRTFVKLTALVVVATLVLLVLAVVSSSAFAMAGVQVKPVVEITADEVTLGDVFEGVTDNASFVLIKAPAAGERIEWNAATLQKVATHFNLPYTAKASDVAVIQKAAETLSYEQIHEAVVEALRAEGMDGRFDISLNALQDQDWLVKKADDLKVERMAIDREKSTFRVVLKAGDDSLVSDGVITALVAVPTLRRSLTPGERIADADLVYVDMKLAELKKDAVLQGSSVVGLTPRKAMAVGSTLKLADVVAPKLIKRGDTVALVFKNSRMQVSTQGKAEEDGVLGARVSVLNTSSNRKVYGTVSQNGDVVVMN